MRSYGSVIKMKPETLADYKKYHVAVWPEVLDTIHHCHVRNYSIYLKDDLLFRYFEYHGTDYAADMARMAADPKTRKWFAIVMPMQQPLESGPPSEWWGTWKKFFTAIDP